MKTFEEAVKSTVLEDLKGRDREVVWAALGERLRRWDEMVNEIQGHELTQDFSKFLLQVKAENELTPVEILCTAIAHGVMFGCVMSAQELPEDLLR